MSVIVSNNKNACSASKKIEEIFHDQGYIYMNPTEPSCDEPVTLRIRAARKNITSVWIEYSGDGESWNKCEMSFDGDDKTGYFEYWKGELPAQNNTYYYRFQAENISDRVYVSRMGTDRNEPEFRDGWYVMPGFSTPDWAKGALVYNLMPTAFYNADTLNDTAASGIYVEVGWGEEDDGLLRYGGDLKGIEEKLDYIKSLGTDIIYINPIWKCLSGVGYGSTDFEELDGGFGNEEQLKRLTAAVHKKGMRIILDAAIENAALSNNLYNSKELFPIDGAFQDENSQTTEFFQFKKWPDEFRTDWGCIVFDYSNQITRDYFYAKPDSYVPRYLTDYGIDGYRFDVGGDLYGHDRTNIQTLSEIRAAIKGANPDAVFINEQEYDDVAHAYCCDGHWHMTMIYKLRDWIDGTVDNDGLAAALREYVKGVARPVALCCYNIYESHDFGRPYRSSQPEKSNILAAQLLCQTYLGNSWIYYGAENGEAGGNVRWPGFNWDSTAWDYDFHEFQMVLAQLKDEYSAVRTGIIKEISVDSNNKIYAFGRWDENGTVVPVISRNNRMINVQLNVRQLSISDGTVLTDYFNGSRYMVENGIVNVSVIPGGTVLVTGKEASDSRGKYILSKRTESIIRTAEDSFILKENENEFIFAGTPLYDCATVCARYDIKNGGAAYLGFRAGLNRLAASYGVIAGENGKLTLCVRYEDNGELIKKELNTAADSGSIRVIRSFAGKFSIEIVDKATSKRMIVDGSEETVKMCNMAYGGFAPVSGSVQLEQVCAETNPRAYGDNYDGEGLMQPAEWLGNVAGCDLKEKALCLDTQGKTGAVVYYPPTDLNWTAKAIISAGNKIGEGEAVGLVSASTAESYIIAGRTVIDSKQCIFFGKCDNGNTVILAKAEDFKPGQAVTVQLQKLGARYNAFYSYDGGKWFKIAEKAVFCIYSDEKAGLFADTASAVKFDSFTYGDMIYGESSCFTPVAVGTVTPDPAQYERISAMPKMKIGAGEWEYAVGGIHTSTAQGIARIDFAQKPFSDFRADATLKLNSSSGFAGYAFCQTSAVSNDGYILALTADKKLTLFKGGAALAQAALTDAQYEWGRVTLEYRDGLVTAYAGEKITAVLKYMGDLQTGGYFSFISENCPASFNNYNICDLDAVWNTRLCTLESENGRIRLVPANGSVTATAMLADTAATDFKIKMKIKPDDYFTAAGVRLDVIENADEGISVYSEQGSIKVVQNGQMVCAVKAEDETEITVLSENKLFAVYVGNDESPVYKTMLPVRRGCMPILFVRGEKTTFTEFIFSSI